jgi:hypothetical protein
MSAQLAPLHVGKALLYGSRHRLLLFHITEPAAVLRSLSRQRQLL